MGHIYQSTDELLHLSLRVQRREQTDDQQASLKRGEDRKQRCGSGLWWPEEALTEHHVRPSDSFWLIQTQMQLLSASLAPRTGLSLWLLGKGVRGRSIQG